MILVAAVGWPACQAPWGDFSAFTLVIGAALAVSPIVWNHYFVLLLIPLVIVAPGSARSGGADSRCMSSARRAAKHFWPILVAVLAPAVALGWAIWLAWKDPDARLGESGLHTNG